MMKCINSIFTTTFAGLIVLVITGCNNAKTAPRANSSIVPINDQAILLITKAGGAEKVCEEADKVFYYYGFTNRGASHFYIFQDSELTNYLALKALGNVDGIWSGPPDYIKIHVGYRPDGYYIEIVNTNNLVSPIANTGEGEIIYSRVYLHR